MARVELPQSRLKTRRRRRRWILAGGAALFLLLLLGGLVWLSWAPFLRVNGVEVSGAETISSSTIAQLASQDMAGAYLGLFARNNIFLYPRGAITQGLLAQYPALLSADVHAQDFHTVGIKVAERQPVALWCGQSPDAPQNCLFLDDSGTAYALAPTFSGPVYVSYYGALSSASPPVYLTSAQFQSLFALAGTLLQKEPDDSITSVSVDSNQDVHVLFGSGFTLLFNLKDDAGDIFERFSLALTSDVFTGKTIADFEYLDLRFGDKLYYKLK